MSRIAVLVVTLLVVPCPRIAAADDEDCKNEAFTILEDGEHGLPIQINVRFAMSRWRKVSAKLTVLEVKHPIEVDGQRVYVSRIRPEELAEIYVQKLEARLWVNKCTLRFTDSDMQDYPRVGRYSGAFSTYADSWAKVFDDCNEEDARAAIKSCAPYKLQVTSARLGGLDKLKARLLAEKKADTLVAEGEALLRDKRPAEALARFESALTLHPDHFKAREGRDAARRHLEGSRRELEQAISKARELAGAGKLDAARQLAERARGLAPDDPQVTALLAYIATAEQKARADAIRPLVDEARARIQAGDLDAARGLIGRIEAIDPSSAELGPLQRDLAAAEQARRDQDRITGDGPGNTAAQKLVAEGEAAEAGGQPAVALKAYERALQLEPGDRALAERVRKLKARIQQEREAYDAEVRAKVAGNRGLDGKWRPLPLTPEEQMAQWTADMKYASEQLAAGLAKASGADKFGLAVGLGGPALGWGMSALASSVSIATYTQILFNVFTFGPAVALQLGLNGHARKQALQRGQAHLADARTRCDAGALVFCGEAVRLGGSLIDLGRPANERSDSSVLWGPGRLTGPRAAYYWMMGPVFGGYDDGASMAASMTGLSTRIAGRVGLVRAELGVDNRSGSLDDGTEVELLSVSTLLGAQIGAGLLAPYAGFRMGGSFGDPTDVGGREIGLTIGNTFHAHGLFATRGPSHLSLVIDVSRTFAVDSVLRDGWDLSIGFSGYLLPSVTYDPDRLLPGTRSPAVAFPTSYRETMVYAFPLGAGVELVRWNGGKGNWVGGRNPDGTSAGTDRPVMVLGDFSVGVDGDGLRRLGFGVIYAGLRKRLGERVEIGGTGGFGADVLWGRPDAPATLAVIPLRPFVRMRTPRVAIELGAHLPLLWFSRNSEGAATPYRMEAFPGYLYAGFAM